MKTQGKVNEAVLKVVERVARHQAKAVSIWPPICTSIYHQPKRPKTTK